MRQFLEKLPITLRYLLAGGTSTAIDLGILYALTEYAGWWYLASATVAFVVAVVVSFLLQKFYTFAHRDVSRTIVATQSALFLALQITNIGINTLFMYALVEWADVWYFAAQIIAAAIIAIASFFIYRFVIFRTTQNNENRVDIAMDQQSYKDIFNLEETHWWFRGRRDIIRQTLRCFVRLGMERAVDIGCGTGRNAALLVPYAKHIEGIDTSPAAVAIAREKHPAFIISEKDVYAWGASRESFDLVTMFDVLEHVADDVTAVSMIYGRLRQEGQLILTVPAFSFLWSAHDVRLGHFRRYSAATLREVVHRAGFTIQKISYFNFFLFPVIVAVRLWKRTMNLASDSSDFSSNASLFNGVLSRIFSLERFLLRYGSLPFGVSLLCVAIKRKE